MLYEEKHKLEVSSFGGQACLLTESDHGVHKEMMAASFSTGGNSERPPYKQYVILGHQHWTFLFFPVINLSCYADVNFQT